MQRFLIALGCTFTLAACGGSGGGAVSCEKQYWDPEEQVGLCIPNGWGVIDPETLRQRGVPDDAIVAFQAEEAVSGHFPTVTVTKELLAQVTTPEAYSDASIRSVTVLPGYELLESTPIEVAGLATRLHVFTAQPVTDEPARRFYQVSTTRDTMGYSVTATVPASVTDTLESQIVLVLQSLTFSTEEE
jgi:hypothetical protein